MNRLPVTIGQEARKELCSLVAEHGIDKITVVWDTNENALDVEIDN